MEDLYFTGWLLAVGLGFIKMVMGFSMLNSTRARNLKKIGLHFHPFSGQFKDSPASFGGLVFYVIYLLAIAPIFSWISFISGVWPFISAWTNRVDVPEKIREIQYKIASVDLSKDEVLSLQNEVLTFHGQTPNPVITSNVETESGDDYTDKNILQVGDSEWPAEFEIEPNHKRLIYDARTPDYDSIFHSIHEYRFENGSVFMRTIEDSVDNYGKVSFHIKDNVVLESEIQRQCQENKFFKLEEQLKRYREQVEWSKVELHQLRFFIMSFHPEVFPPLELRKLARQELERIKIGRAKFDDMATGAGCLIIEEKDFTRFRFPENCDEMKKKEIECLFSDENIAKFNLSRRELDNAQNIISCLLSFLGEKKNAA